MQTPNPHKVLAVKRKYFPRPRGFWRFFDAFCSGVMAAAAKAIGRRPDLFIHSGRSSWAQAQDEPHPTRIRTSAAPLRGARRLCRGPSPGRSRYSFVPDVVASRKTAGSSPRRERPVREGSRSGRVVRRFLRFTGRDPAGVGWTWDGASAPSPHYWRRPRADLVPSPDPPADRGRTTAVDSKAGAAGVPSKRQAAGATAKDIPERTPSPMTMVCHRCGWPHRRPLGFGSPAAPRLNVSRNAGRQRPPSYGACGRRLGPACGPTRSTPLACPSATPAVAASR